MCTRISQLVSDFALGANEPTWLQMFRSYSNQVHLLLETASGCQTEPISVGTTSIDCHNSKKNNKLMGEKMEKLKGTKEDLVRQLQ